MHEWALAESVIATVERVVRENGDLPLRAVQLRIGELQAVDLEALRAGLEAALAESGLESDVGPASLFQVEVEKASFECNRCGVDWLLSAVTGLDAQEREAIHLLPESAHAVLRCPTCGSPDFRLKAGRGITIQAIELEASA